MTWGSSFRVRGKNSDTTVLTRIKTQATAYPKSFYCTVQRLGHGKRPVHRLGKGDGPVQRLGQGDRPVQKLGQGKSLVQRLGQRFLYIIFLKIKLLVLSN